MLYDTTFYGQSASFHPPGIPSSFLFKSLSYFKMSFLFYSLWVILIYSSESPEHIFLIIDFSFGIHYNQQLPHFSPVINPNVVYAGES